MQCNKAGTADFSNAVLLLCPADSDVCGHFTPEMQDYFIFMTNSKWPSKSLENLLIFITVFGNLFYRQQPIPTI